MAASRRKMRDIDGGDGIIGHNTDRAAGTKAAQRRFHFQDGQGAPQATGIDVGWDVCHQP